MKGYLIIVSLVTIVIPSIQHYLPPPDMCLLAKSCNHTWVPECGIDGNISIKRLFLDICDMYEYNCDYKTEYTKIDIKKCPQNSRQSGNLDNYATDHTISAPIISTIRTCISSTTSTPISSTATTPITSTKTTSIKGESLHDTKCAESTTLSLPPFCLSDLSTISETMISTTSEITTTKPVAETTPATTILLTSTTHNQSLPLTEPGICTDSTNEPNQTKVKEELETATQVNVNSTINNHTNVDEYATTAPINSAMRICISSTITTPIYSTTMNPIMRAPLNDGTLSLPNDCDTYIIIYINDEKNISTTSEIITKVEPVIEKTPTTTILSTTLSTTYSTTTPSNTISTDSTSNNRCTASIYPGLREHTSDHDCSRKTTPELSSTSEISITKKVLSTIETTKSTTETIKSTTEVNPTTHTTSQIIETTTTHIQPLLLLNETDTEPIQTKITEELETTTEFTSTTQVNMTSTVINQTNVEYTLKTKLNATCSNYRKDCNRPITWETTAEGETRDFYQILKQRYGNRVRLLRDTTHWPRQSALNIGGRKKSFVFERQNFIEN